MANQDKDLGFYTTREGGEWHMIWGEFPEDAVIIGRMAKGRLCIYDTISESLGSDPCRVDEGFCPTGRVWVARK